MASPGVGAKSYMQFARETVWGTAVAATKRIGIVRHSIKPVMKQVRSNLLTGSYIKSNIFNVMESAEGQIETYMTYNDLLLFIDCCMGSAAFAANGGATTGTNPYTHVFTDAREFHNSLTIELIEGDIPATKCQRVLGAKIVGLTIRGEAADLVNVVFDVVGKQKQTNQTPTPALTANTPINILTAHGTTVADGSGDAAADQILASFEFMVRSGVQKRERCGSAFIFEPIRDGDTVATMKFRREFRTRTAMDAYIAGTSQNPSVVFASSPSSLTFQMDASKIVNYDHGVDGFGIMFVEHELESILTAGVPDFGAKITVVNAQATITT